MERQSEHRIERLRHFLSDIVYQDAVIVDIGCGDGSTLRPLASQGAYVIGVDYDFARLDMARSHDYEPLLSDLTYGLPLDTGVVDVLVAGEVIEHLVDTDGFLEECRRVLKPGGQLVLSTPNVVSLTSRCRVVIGRLPTPVHYGNETLDGEQRAGGRGHLRAFTQGVLVGLFEKHGFEIERIATDVIIIPKLATLPWPFRLGTRLGESLIVSARAPEGQ